MSRLNQGDREAIVHKLMSRAFGDRRKALKLLEREAFTALRNAMYTEAERTQIDALPQGWLPESSEIHIRSIDENFSGPVSRFANEDYYYGSVRFKGSSLPPEVDTLLAVRGQLANDEKRVKNEIKGVVNSVTTWKKLFEIWPEAKDVLAPLAPLSGGGTGQAIAVIPQKLNAELKLP